MTLHKIIITHERNIHTEMRKSEFESLINSGIGSNLTSEWCTKILGYWLVDEILKWKLKKGKK